ncbi:cation/H(+) antiporter 14 [Punica granatum]|uniref:Cation/H(+) antiporter 14 n=2 Tax=Punica granatum TaxID=22663 RepID=A0A6P8CU01_PUNGR|nr:cation/H(+) antiporter 14 [Punica granatum]PKI54657.1 hypothetical protein CRG98_024942 [Punica granatum]
MEATGTVLNEKLVCQNVDTVPSHSGHRFWSGGNPFAYTMRTVLAELILFFFMTQLLCLLLKPFRQSTTIVSVIAGTVISLALHAPHTDKFLRLGDRLILRTFAEFGFMMHMFVLGVHIDLTTLRNTGKKAVALAILGSVLALALGGFTLGTIQRISPFDANLRKGIALLLPVNSMTSCIVTFSILHNLNIINSEVGRLAASSAMVSDVLGWFMAFVVGGLAVALQASTMEPLFPIFITLSYYCVLFFLVRPFIIWLTKQSEGEKPMHETHFVFILCIVAASCFLAECLGQHSSHGAFFLGLILPDGPPLGPVLVQKLETFASTFILPVYCTLSGLRTDLHSLATGTTLKLELLIMAGYIGKFAGIIFPSLLCFHIKFRDSLCVALILCCKGIMEIAIYNLWRDMKVINTQLFTLLMVNMVVVTGLATFTVSYLYDPSERYRAFNRRAIKSTNQNLDLRVLICIHDEDHVYPMISLLRASNPTRNKPLSVLVLHLLELSGSALSVLTMTSHYQFMKKPFQIVRSEKIVSAFNHYEKQERGHVSMQHFTASAPYSSMHNDICTLALDKKVSIIILPFHKQWTSEGIETSSPSIRNVNRNVLEKSPCSIGVLVDRSYIHGTKSGFDGQSPYNVGMLFFGGPDDSEALAYSKRMSEHPSISLTVVQFKPEGDYSEPCVLHGKCDGIDVMSNLINGCKIRNKMSITYMEEAVRDGLQTTHVIRSMGDKFDMVIVGKHQDPSSPVLLGLTDWSECPELGVVGDMLAASNFRFSVLVVQQEPLMGSQSSLRHLSSHRSSS